MMTLVMKFGGTSVGTADAIRRTAQLIVDAKATWNDVVIVSSAMGSKPVKVTDLLLNGAHAAANGDDQLFRQTATHLRTIHNEAIGALLNGEGAGVSAEIDTFITHYEAVCDAVYFLGELTTRALDTIGGMGEQMSVRLLAAHLRELGHPAQALDATELIVTDSNFQNAAPLFDATEHQTRARLLPLLAQGIIPVVTGFIAANENGITTTLGRGGSDYSAAILGQALHAEEVWIWTDVDGVMSADPRLVPAARTIPALSHREVSELAYYGARVLHPKTMRPVVEQDIPLRIKNTFNPVHPGTVIVRHREQAGHNIEAVTAIKQLSLITVEGKGMMGIPGIAARTFGAVARRDVSVLLISQASSEQSICFALPQTSSAEIVAALTSEFRSEIERGDIDRVWAEEPVSIVTIVGVGMRHTPGIAGRIFTALGENRVNIIAIAQGSSEVSISLVVHSNDTLAAVQHIHDLIVQ
jgi:aspartate kinase